MENITKYEEYKENVQTLSNAEKTSDEYINASRALGRLSCENRAQYWKYYKRLQKEYLSQKGIKLPDTPKG